MAKEYARTQRVADYLQRELAALIQHEVRDPRVGMVSMACVATLAYFFLWDYWPAKKCFAAKIVYIGGSFVMLVGFNLARGFCWSLLSKQVPTNAKGFGNISNFVTL